MYMLYTHALENEKYSIPRYIVIIYSFYDDPELFVSTFHK